MDTRSHAACPLAFYAARAARAAHKREGTNTRMGTQTHYMFTRV